MRLYERRSFDGASFPQALHSIRQFADGELDVAVSPVIELANRHSEWLSARQKTIADNVAHSNVPGYKALDVVPFASVVDRHDMGVKTTSSMHLSTADQGPASIRRYRASSPDTSHSGNSVSIDQQMLRASDVRQSYTLNMNIVRSFNRMLLAATKG
jgi:flagellar basal-body rod protein FlgB